jgi:peptidyl-prolyl cis-trans isomerase A (cyclophilin A)
MPECDPLQYKVMFRSSYRLALILPVVLFSFAAYAQQDTSPQTNHPSGLGSPQSQQQQPAAAPPASSDQSTPPESGQTEALPDDPGTTAHVEPPLLPDGPTVVFDTTMGRMTCGLYAKEAPLTVANFVGLATGSKEWTDPATHQKIQGKPLYNGTTFHRVIPGFMVQGGDPLGTGTGDPGYYFNDEITPNLNFDVAGRLAMANSGPNTNGSQFFITVTPQPTLDEHYSIFGQCDPASVLVAESITQVPRDSRDKPIEPVYLNKLTIVQPGQPLPAPPPAAPQAGAAATTHP